MADKSMLDALYFERSGEKSLASSYRFEQFILNLSSAYADDNGIKFIPHPKPTTTDGKGTIPDGIFPDGFESLPPPTVVEVRSSSSLFQLVRRLRALMDRVRAENLPSILLVAPVDVGESALNKLKAQVSAEGFALAFWGEREIRQMAEKYAGRFSGDLTALSLEPLRRALDEPADDWRQASQGHLTSLSNVYSTEGVSLFLGAGTSAGAGLPSWEDSVAALFLAVFVQQLDQRVDNESAKFFVEIAKELNGNSPLLLARYPRRGLSGSGHTNEDAFQALVSQTLYRDVEAGRTSALLEAIAKLCMPLRTGWNVHSVVTYNFDDLLESLLQRQSVAHRSIYYSERLANESELPIYHVHGYLPRVREGLEQLDKSLLAFSEEGYHELFRDPYHWTNIVQLNLLRERTCLFPGLSFADPNLRRLLEIAARGSEHARHYAFMKRTGISELRHKNGLEAKVPERTIKGFLATHHALQERVLAELGVQVIWFENFDDMPDALLSLPPSRKNRGLK